MTETKRATESTDKIEKRIELKAPLARVWRALTDYKEFGEWFRVRIDSPFEAGKASSGNMTYPGYEHVRWNAVIQRIDPQHFFSYTWHPYAVDPNVDYSGETPTLVEFRLSPAPNGTLLEVTESGFDKIPAHRQEEALRKNSGGWAAQMTNIEKYVADNPR